MGDTYDIFIGSLKSCVTEESLVELFQSFGKIVKVKIKDPINSGGLKIAFIHYGKESDALKAVEDMSGYVYNGVPLQVRKSDRWLQRQAIIPQNAGSTGHMKEYFGKGVGKGTAPRPKIHIPGGHHLMINTTTVPQVMMENSTSPGKVLRESVAVTHVEDPVTFYAYFASKNNDLNNLTRELQNVCPALPPISRDPLKDQVCGSMYSVDKQWYRCKILKTDMGFGTSVVQYIDFGNVEKVSNSSLVDLPLRLQIIAPFSMKCVLKNLIPVPNNRSCYDEALNYIKHLLIDKMVSAVLHVIGNGSYLQVSEINQNGMNVVASMIKKGYVVHSSNSNTSTTNSDFNRNSTVQNYNISGRQNLKGKKQMVSSHSKNSYSSPVIDQEKAQLITENKKLKYENAQALGKHRALQMELKNINKTLAEPNPFTELPSILADIDRVRLLRQQLPVRSSCIDYIDTAVKLLEKPVGITRPLDKEHRDSIQQKVSQYYKMQQEILDCLDKDVLQNRIEERNTFRETLREELKSFCIAANSGEFVERLHAFKTVLLELKRIYKTFLEMKMFSETDLPLEELQAFYTSTKAEKSAGFLELQRKTDFAHRNFFRTLQPAFQNLDQRDVKCTSVTELTDTLSDLKTCLADEIKSNSLEDTPEASVVGVLSHVLCSRLEMELEGMEGMEHMEKQYSLLVESLSFDSSDSSQPVIDQLLGMRKDRKKLKSKLRHILADKIDLEENDEASDSESSSIRERLAEVQLCLQKQFHEEDKLIGSIAHLQDSHFPELNNLYPDFGLLEYNKYKGLVKSLLEIEYFDLNPLPSSLQFHTYYTTTYMNKPVRFQEYQLSGEVEKEALLECILQYSAISHPRLMPVDAVFFAKKWVHAYVQQPLLLSLRSDLEDSSEDLKPADVIKILKGILEAVAILHSRGLVHGCLHPSTIYLNPDKEVVVDSIPFQPHKSVGMLPTVNGIVFHLMDQTLNDCYSYDIYSFACLALWLMYPKTEFEVTTSGKPNTELLHKIGYRAEVMELVDQILELPMSFVQTADLLHHSALNRSPQILDQLELSEAEISSVSDVGLNDSQHTSEVAVDEYEEPNTVVDVEEGEEPECDSTEEDSDNAEETLLEYNFIRMNQCPLVVPETLQNT